MTVAPPAPPVAVGQVRRPIRVINGKLIDRNSRQRDRVGRRMRRWLVRLVTRVVAQGVAFPLRTGLLVPTAAAVYVGWDSLVWAGAVVATWAGLRGLGWGTLGRSPRGPLNLNPLVKSLRLRRRVTKHWTRAMRDAGLTKTRRGGEPVIPGHKRITLTPLGVTMRVDMGRIGATAEDLRGKRENLQARFRAVDSQVTGTGPGWVRLDLRHTDPLTRKIGTADLPPPSRRGYVVVGLTADGYAVEKELRLPSLIVGAQGSGKSNEVWTTVRALIVAGIPFRLRIFDPKGGQEFTSLQPGAFQYERNPLNWGTFLGRALGGLVTRQQELAEQGIQNLTQYTDENPLDLMIVDELVTVAAFKSQQVKYEDHDGQHTIKAEDALMLFLSQGRSAGYSMLALSQLGQKAVLGPAVMDLFGYRTCLRVGSDELVNVILGDGASKQYPAHKLPKEERFAGAGFGDLGERGIVKYRGARLSDAERRWVVKQLREMNMAQRRAREARRAA